MSVSSMLEITPSIRKLDETVVNRIAAGEVVQRPAAAIKEMLENCLDAGSTSITVTIKGGGLQLLQIQDNGHGIRKEDLGIVCERFTTSKLTSFDDLKTITTFGFRGEALASITHVAHVSITTRTADSPCAFKARYLDGKLAPMKAGDKVDPKPCAGTVGTTITVEDLFYNMQTRRQAFKNPNEQYQRILDVVTKYSVHFGEQKVSFTCRKQGQAMPDLHTPVASSSLENIKIAYGASVARELINFELDEGKYITQKADGITRKEDESLLATAGLGDKLVFSVIGQISNANYSSKKGICIIFINNRLVECQSIKKVAEAVYNEILPRHTHPFIYLSIRMPPQHVDVNVHPTKKEVHFMYEEEFLEKLYNGISQRLRSSNESRTFYTQSVINLNKNSGGGIQSISDSYQSEPSSSASTIITTEAVTFPEENDQNTLAETVTIYSDKSEEPRRKIARGNEVKVDYTSTELLRESNQNGCQEEASSSPILSSSAPTSLQGIKTSSSSGGAPKAAVSHGTSKASSSSSSGATKPQNKLVRTDPSLLKIDAFFRPAVGHSSSQPDGDGGSEGSQNDDIDSYDIADVNGSNGVVCGVCSTVNPSENAQKKRSIKKGFNSKSSPMTENTINEDGDEDFKENSNVDDKTGGGGNDIPGEFALGCSCCAPANGSKSKKRNLMATGLMIDDNTNGNIANTALRGHRSISFIDTKCQYVSVQSLFSELKSHRHEGLEKILKQHTFVGLVDYTYCSIQFGTRLLLLDHSTLLRHLFYQLVIRRFAEMPRIILGKPVSIKDYVLAALNSPESQWEIKDGLKEDIVNNVLTILTENAEMLEEYFKIGVNEFGMLCTLPELLAGHTPTPEGLPMFLLRLATETNWEDETQCFRSIATEIGFLYASLPIEYNVNLSADISVTEKTAEISRSFPGAIGNELFSSILMPAIRSHLIAPKQCAEDGNTVVQLAALEQLYKIFERC